MDDPPGDDFDTPSNRRDGRPESVEKSRSTAIVFIVGGLIAALALGLCMFAAALAVIFLL